VADVDEEGLEALDGHEPGYRRTRLPIEVADGVVDAWVYRAEPRVREQGLRPFSWYVDHILHGGHARGLPPGYLSRVAAIPTLVSEADAGCNG
jgi:hypothetical protein